MANINLKEQMARLNLKQQTGVTERLFEYGMRDALILFLGGLALSLIGVVLWWIGASWLSDWLGNLATDPGKKADWLGAPCQAVLTILELAIMLKLKDKPQLLFVLAGLVIIDAGTNTAGTLNFLSDLIAHGKLPVIHLDLLTALVLALPIAPIVALLTYGPEKFVTWGGEMLLDGWKKMRLIWQVTQALIRKEQEDDAKKSGSGSGSGKGFTVIQGGGNKQ